MNASLFGWLALGAVAACTGGAASTQDNTHGAASAGDAGVGGGVSFGGQQDIGEFRGVLEAGQVPGPDTLDANGFFNEHYAPPPADACTDVLCMTPGLSVGKDWVLGKHQAALQIAINTNVDPTNYPKQPLNLVVVIDHSGSMASDGRLQKVKAGLNVLIDSLDATDRLAIVEFDDRSRSTRRSPRRSIARPSTRSSTASRRAAAPTSSPASSRASISRSRRSRPTARTA